MHIAQLIEGSGNHYAGAGIREQALSIALRRLGHRVSHGFLTRRFLFEEEENGNLPLFYEVGHIALEEASPVYRSLPGYLSRFFDSDWLRDRYQDRLTTPEGKGSMVLSLLRGAQGRQSRDAWQIIDWLRSLHPDVVSISSLKHVALIPLIQKELKVPVVLHLLGQYRDLQELPKVIRDEAWKLAGESAGKADAIVSPSLYFADLMSGMLNLERSRIQVIPNGISLNYYSIRPASPLRPTLGYLGHLSQGNGLEEIIDVYQNLKKELIPDLELFLAGSIEDGDFEYLSQVMHPVSADTDQGHVRLFPNLPLTEKVTFLHGLSVLSVPARFDAFGNYLIEAMATGVPVVQPEDGSFPEIVRKTGAGLLFPPGNPSAYAEILGQLLLDHQECHRLGNAGRQAALELFSSERMAGEVLALYQSLRPGNR